MKKFTFSVKDSFFPQVFNGEWEATTIQEAEKEIRDEYAYELDTTPEELTVTIQEVI